jgi:hypothetical protein
MPEAVLDRQGQQVLVEAVVSGGTPGAVTLVDATEGPLAETGWAIGGTHALGLPTRLHIVGIATHAAATHGWEFSPSVMAATDPAAGAVLQLIQRPPVLAHRFGSARVFRSPHPPRRVLCLASLEGALLT